MPDGAYHTVDAMNGGGGRSDGVCIALDGDKLKPREDQRKGGNGFGINEDGAGYTLTGVDRHGVAYENDHLNRCEVARSLNGDHDDRVTDSGTSVVHVATAYKLDSTASNSMKSANPNSGFHETQVAACLDATSPDPTKNQGGNVIVSTNSNGGDVAATLTQDLAKQTGAQQANGGGVCRDTEPLGIGRDVFNSGANASYSPDIRVGVQPTLTARTTQGAVCARLKGDE